MNSSSGDVPNYELRELVAADIAKLARQRRDLFEAATWHAAAVERSLEAPGCLALLARTAGRAAGLILARVAADECEILWLVVPAPWRRRGIGKRLLRAALQMATGLGARTAHLEVLETNQAAIALYGAEGFRPCGQRCAYYGSGHEDEASDALLYKKALTSGEAFPVHSPVNRVKMSETQTR